MEACVSSTTATCTIGENSASVQTYSSTMNALSYSQCSQSKFMASFGGSVVIAMESHSFTGNNFGISKIWDIFICNDNTILIAIALLYQNNSNFVPNVSFLNDVEWHKLDGMSGCGHLRSIILDQNVTAIRHTKMEICILKS